MLRLVLLLVGITVTTEVNAVPSSITLGGIFSTAREERVFRYAVSYVNRRGVMGHGIDLNYVTNVTDYTSTFDDIQTACQMAERGVAAIVGPMSSTSVTAVSPVATGLNIPLIAAAATTPHLGDKEQYPFLVRMLPPDTIMSLALADLVAFYGWKKMAMMTSDDDYGLTGVAQFQSEAATRGWRIYTVQNFRVTNPPTDLNVIPQLKITKETGVRVIILHCEADVAKEVLKQAEGLGMTGAGWAWVVTDGTTDTKEVSTPGLIGTAPAYRRGLLYLDLSTGWKEMNEVEEYAWGKLDVFAALIVDAVLTFAYAVRSMYEDPVNDLVDVISDSRGCGEAAYSPWIHGQLMLKHITDVQQDGVASFISFNPTASPLNPAYDIVNLKRDSWVKVGEWDTEEGLTMQFPEEVTFMGGQRAVLDFRGLLANRTLDVVTVDGAPFINLVTDDYDETDLQPRDVDGYCIDMLDKLAEMGGFKYKLHLQETRTFGLKNSDGEWNGMIRELFMKETDMAVSYITISLAREEDIDFTMPYLSLGLSFILKKAEKLPLRPFAFLDPFTPELWIYIMGTMVVVGVVISLCSKVSPNDYHGEIVYGQDGKLEENYMSSYFDWKKFQRLKDRMMSKMDLPNAVMFSWASLLSQGGDEYPKSLSGRIVSVTWWFAIVILTSTYTANLTAFLTASRIQTSITSVEELAAQSKIVYGTREFGTPRNFFRDSAVTLYNEMYIVMNRRNSYVHDLTEAFERVRTGTYAWIGDRPLLEYQAAQQPCDLEVIGREFGKVGYGIALQKNSPYKEELDLLILQLRENGFMDDLKHKWFVERGECGGGGGDGPSSAAEEEEDETEGGRLQYTQVLGVFYIMYIALALSLVIVFVECGTKCGSAVDKNDPFKVMPQSLPESISKHARLFKEDVVEDWLPRLPAIGCLQSASDKSANAHAPAKPQPPSSVVDVRSKSPGVSSRGSDNVNFRMAQYVSTKTT